MNWIIRQIAKITLIGKLVEKLGPKVPVIFIVISLIFAAFYIPYEYENFLEFRTKYPDDKIGLILNLARPIIINLILIIFIISAFSAEKERKERIEREEAERQRKEAEALARKEEAMRKINQRISFLGNSSFEIFKKILSIQQAAHGKIQLERIKLIFVD